MKPQGKLQSPDGWTKIAAAIDAANIYSTVRAPFGKHEGVALDSIPFDYLDREVSKWDRSLFVRQVERFLDLTDSLSLLATGTTISQIPGVTLRDRTIFIIDTLVEVSDLHFRFTNPPKTP